MGLLRFALLVFLYIFLLLVVRLIHRDIQRETLTPSKPSTAPSGYLKWREGFPGLEGKSFTLGELSIIGRDPSSHVVIPVPHVSGRHAAIWWDGSSFVILDLGSANGTQVNGVPVTGPIRLKFGDSVVIGGNRMELVRWEHAGGSIDGHRAGQAAK